jgi:hypothetical protein
LPRWFFVSSGPAIAESTSAGKKKGRTMNPRNRLKRSTLSVRLITLVLVGFGPLLQMRAVMPTPDGCYPNFTTAEGCNALATLGSGIGNTGVGWYSLFSVGDAATIPGLVPARLRLPLPGRNPIPQLALQRCCSIPAALRIRPLELPPFCITTVAIVILLSEPSRSMTTLTETTISLLARARFSKIFTPA